MSRDLRFDIRLHWVRETVQKNFHITFAHIVRLDTSRGADVAFNIKSVM